MNTSDLLVHLIDGDIPGTLSWLQTHGRFSQRCTTLVAFGDYTVVIWKYQFWSADYSWLENVSGTTEEFSDCIIALGWQVLTRSWR